MLNIYKASAGSGKTFTLAREYIKLLLGIHDPETGRMRLNRNRREAHRHILAITFTNKATEEMKRRILHELAVLGDLEPGWGKPSPYENDFIALFHCSREELRDAAASTLVQLLFDFNFFSVSTIDAFFQVVLRTFAREADLTGNYEVELDDDYAIAYGVRQMLTALNAGDRNPEDPGDVRLKDWLTRFMASRLESGAAFNLFNRKSEIYRDIIKFIRSVTNETFTRNYEPLMEYLRQPDLIKRFATEVDRQVKNLREGVSSACRAALGEMERLDVAGNKSVNATVESRLRLWASGRGESDVKKTIVKVTEDIDSAYYASFRKLKSKTPAAYNVLDRLIGEACGAIADATTRINVLTRSTRGLYLLGLIARVFHYVDEFRNDNELILLSDTNQLLHKIIGEDDAPFVYERIGQWFNHFLIDEFQDTSPLQWENLKPLLKESLGSGNYNLIIGDEKQCIYRFRDSDPGLLKNIHGSFPGKSGFMNDNVEGNTNWRSSAEVVRFNNTLFTAMARNLGFIDIYSGVVQRISPAHVNHHGYVKVVALNDDYETSALDVTVKEISRQLESGYRPDDIAVLVRTNTQGAKVINHLMGIAEGPLAGVRVVSDDSMFLNSSPSVRLIVSVMKFIAGSDYVSDSRNKPAREVARLLNKYEYCSSRGDAPGVALSRALNEELPVEEIATDAAAMRCTSLPSLVERIVSRYISPSRREEENMFITAFQDIVIDYVSHGATDLRSFISWWDEKGCRSTVAGSGESSLRVLTIHKSKGLEFKCVHVPFVDRRVPRFMGEAWFVPGDFDGIDKDVIPPLLPIVPGDWMEGTGYDEQYRRMVGESVLDELNTVYVAFTRAVDELTVCYKSPGAATTGAFVADALAIAGDEFCASLEGSADMRSGGHKVSPYIPLYIGGDGVTEVGVPTVSVGDTIQKSRTALDPESEVTMPPYYSYDRDDLWANTVIEPVTDISRPRERGVVLHYLLSKLRCASELKPTVRRMVSRGYIPREDAVPVIQLLTEKLSMPRVRPWFEGFRRVVAERPVEIAGGATQRPDRVVWTADGHVDVIDFKTGERDDRRYASQVKGYVELYRRMGFDKVRGFLWYITSGDVVEIVT